MIQCSLWVKNRHGGPFYRCLLPQCRKRTLSGCYSITSSARTGGEDGTVMPTRQIQLNSLTFVELRYFAEAAFNMGVSRALSAYTSRASAPGPRRVDSAMLAPRSANRFCTVGS